MSGEDNIPSVADDLNEPVLPLKKGVDPVYIPDVIGGFLTPAAYFFRDALPQNGSVQPVNTLWHKAAILLFPIFKETQLFPEGKNGRVGRKNREQKRSAGTGSTTNKYGHVGEYSFLFSAAMDLDQWNKNPLNLGHHKQTPENLFSKVKI
jgi:hypothetical protein